MSEVEVVGGFRLVKFLFAVAPLALGIVAVAFWIGMLIDCATKEPSEGNDKIVWILIILLVPFAGALVYYIVRRPVRMARTDEAGRPAAEHDLVVIELYDSAIEAGTARSLLESEGIVAFMWTGGFSGWRPAVEMSQGTTLLVPKDAVEAAREILGLSEPKEE